MTKLYRPVAPWGAGVAMAPPDFGTSVNPISILGVDYAPHHYWHPQIFIPSDGPEFDTKKVAMAKSWQNAYTRDFFLLSYVYV